MLLWHLGLIPCPRSIRLGPSRYVYRTSHFELVTPAQSQATGATIVAVKPRILVVENEQAIAEPLAEALEREGFAAEVASTLTAATDAYRRQPPDLILLDVMLPDGDGRDLCRDIRKESDVPIIMLTARSEEVDRVVGDRKSTRLNSSHIQKSRMPSSA